MEKGEWIAYSKPAGLGVIHCFEDNSYRIMRLTEENERGEAIEKIEDEFEAMERFYSDAGELKEKLEIASRIKNFLVQEGINEKVPHADLFDFVKEVWRILNRTGLTNRDFICQWTVANGLDTEMLTREEEKKFEEREHGKLAMLQEKEK